MACAAVSEKNTGPVGNNRASTAFKLVLRTWNTPCAERNAATTKTRHPEESELMESGELEGEVLNFIFENIDTVPHLEALLLIWQSGSSEWSPDQLASRIYVSPQRAHAILDDLQRRGFIERKSEETAAYTFAKHWDAQTRFMPRLADAYRTNLVRITTMIHSKGSASVREFARAFQIKKDK